MALRRFASRFASFRDLAALLEDMEQATPKPTLLEMTTALRAHARQMKSEEATRILSDQRFRTLTAAIHSQVDRFEAQNLLDLLFWARAGSESNVLTITEAIRDKEAVASRLADLCAGDAFRNRQLVPLFSDASALKIKTEPAEQVLISRLRNPNEMFSADTVRLLFFALRESSPSRQRAQLLEHGLSRWLSTNISEIEPEIVSKVYADLLRIAKHIRSDTLDLALHGCEENLVARMSLLFEKDLRFLFQSIAVNPIASVSLLASVVAHSVTLLPSLSYQSHLALVNLATVPVYQSLFSVQTVKAVLEVLEKELAEISSDSVEGLMIMLGKVDKAAVPDSIREKLKEFAVKSASPLHLLLCSQLESDPTAFLASVESLFGAHRETPIRSVIATLCFAHSREKFPASLKTLLRLYDSSLFSMVTQNSSVCINNFVLMREMLPAAAKLKSHYNMLLEHMEKYFPERKVDRSLEFLRLCLPTHYGSCQKVLSANLRTAISSYDLREYVKKLPRSLRLKEVAEFLHLVTPVLPIDALCEAWKFEFDDIPERFMDLLVAAPDRLITNHEFLLYSHRFIANPTLSGALLARLSREIEEIKVLSLDSQLRIAAFLSEKGLLSAKGKQKLEKSAQLRDSMASRRAMGLILSGTPESLSDLVDVVLYAAGRNLPADEESALFESVVQRLPQHPLASSLRIFDYYPVAETRDSITERLLAILQPLVQKDSRPEVITRFLKPAATIQWGSVPLLSAMLRTAFQAFSNLQPEEKRMLVGTMGQLGCREGTMWQPIVRDLSATSELMERNGHLLVHSLHQARFLTLKLWGRFLTSYTSTLLASFQLLTGPELRKVLLSLFPKNFYLLTDRTRDSLLRAANSYEGADFHSYLLACWLNYRPEGAKFGTKKDVRTWAEKLKETPVVGNLPKEAVDVLEQHSIVPSATFVDSFYVPYYIPSLHIGLWPSTRAFSALSSLPIGDFALLSSASKSFPCPLRLFPSRLLKSQTEIVAWLQSEGIVPK